MSRIWRDGKLVGSVGEGRGCRSGCVFPTGDDEPFGFGVGVGKAGYEGIGQAFMGTEDFPGSGDAALFIGTDKRVYEERQGLIECVVPAKPTSDRPNVYVSGVDWPSFPYQSELAWLFHNFFCQYTDREVVMLVGKRRGKVGWLYYVPEQVGTCGSVKWTADDEEMNRFQEQAQWVGTIHSHPGNCCKPSQTDIDDWAEPEKSGLHLVFGRNGSYTINGAIAERTFELYTNKVHKEDCRGCIRFQTSKGQSLEELLKRPKPVVTRTVSRGKINSWSRGLQELRDRQGAISDSPLWDPETGLPLWHDDKKNDKDFVEETLDVIGALPLVGEFSGVPVLRIVEYNGQLYALTLGQYAELVEWCKDVCPVPKSRRLRLCGTEGGRK